MENTNNFFVVDAFTTVPLTSYVKRIGSRYETTVNINGDEFSLADLKEILDSVEVVPKRIFSDEVNNLVSLKVLDQDEEGFVCRSLNYDKLVERLTKI